MKAENNSIFPVVAQANIGALVQYIGEVLSTAPELLVNVEEINISVVPVVEHRVDIRITPKN